MKILNFGSLNIDHLYRLNNFVRPGETISCSSYNRSYGGKGLNQSIALAHGGAEVYHAGKVGDDGEVLKKKLRDHGVYTELIATTPTPPTGHAIIQVNDAGENAIVIDGGANRCISSREVQSAMEFFSAGDCLLVQNEISMIAEIMTQAKDHGLTIAFNPAPLTAEVDNYPLELVDLFIVNETEAQGITGEQDRDMIFNVMANRFPKAAVIYTLGAKGALYIKGSERYSVNAVSVDTVDTTAAGDTFIGFFLASIAQGENVLDSLHTATNAAALSVTKNGAAESIPSYKKVRNFMNDI